MNVISYMGRDVLVWTLPDGSKQPFYKSSGRNSHRPGEWFPFDGWMPTTGAGWFIKDKYCLPQANKQLHRYGSKGLQTASEAIKALNPPIGMPVVSGFHVNRFLYDEGYEVFNKRPWAPDEKEDDNE